MKMSKFSIKKKSKEIPTEAVLAYSKGNMLEKIGKKDQAIQSYIVAGNQNHVKAQYRLGELYLEKKQYVEAEKWFSFAYKSGKEEAAFDLGNMYYNIEGYVYALYWYEKQALNGDLRCQNNLGVVHFKLRDFHNSEKWLKIAANANNGVACFNLGNIYVSLNREEDAIEYYKTL